MNARRAVAAIALLATGPAWSCDLCAVYSAAQAQGQASGFYGALTEQFTRYDQLRHQGHRIGEDADQFLDSAVTQLIAGYGFSDRASVQLALPYISRRFRRPEGGEIDTGNVAGLGDATLVGSYTPYRHLAETGNVALHVFAGLKFPTGNSDRLAEEVNESDEGSAPGEAVNGIHGHDLALGSGSTDVLFGISTEGRVQRWLASLGVQYAYRRRGDFDYRFGDDLQWRAAVGRFLVLNDERTLSAALSAEGEQKQYDELAGERLGDTHCGHWMLGPRLEYTSQGRWSAELQGLVPVQQFNSETQTTAAYRIRAALGYRF